jgi:hypothetical protein
MTFRDSLTIVTQMDMSALSAFPEANVWDNYASQITNGHFDSPNPPNDDDGDDRHSPSDHRESQDDSSNEVDEMLRDDDEEVDGMLRDDDEEVDGMLRDDNDSNEVEEMLRDDNSNGVDEMLRDGGTSDDDTSHAGKHLMGSGANMNWQREQSKRGGETESVKYNSVTVQGSEVSMPVLVGACQLMWPNRKCV